MSTTTTTDSAQTRAAWAIQTMDTDVVLDMAKVSRDWLSDLLRKELASRGVNWKGEWIGHGAARELWARLSYDLPSGQWVSIPTD